MSERKRNGPAIPTAPLAECPHDPTFPDNLFEGCSSGENYHSSPFKNIVDFEVYAKALFKTLKKNGKGETIFQDEHQFLVELDNAFVHYEMYRPIVTSEICGTFKEQKEYFKNLNDTLQIKKPTSRLQKVQSRLKEITECDLAQRPKALCHLRRLLRAKLDYAIFKRIVFTSIDPKQPLDESLCNDLDQLKKAVNIVRKDLKGKQSGYCAELYLLIEQLGDMYKICSGRKPSVTEPTDASPPDMGRGVFFNLVESILFKVFNKKVADETYEPRGGDLVKPYTIIEGIRFLK